MRVAGKIDLPDHRGPRGFDHADVHGPTGRVYVAHTANDELDVIDGPAGRFLGSIPGLTEVAGALVAADDGLVLTTNRGEGTVGVFPVDAPAEIGKIEVGGRPNGLAFDPVRRRALAASIDEPPGFTVLDVAARKVIAHVELPGRPRWAVHDPATDRFYVNLLDPAAIAVVDPAKPEAMERTIDVGVAGPHGLEADAENGRLFCACDAGELVVLDAASGERLGRAEISGKPDVIWFHAARRRLYVAVGDPGVVDVFDTDSLERLDIFHTERGAKTTAIDRARDRLYVFAPESHRALVLALD